MTIGRLIMAVVSTAVAMAAAGAAGTADAATLGTALPDTTVIAPHRLAWVTPSGELATAGRDLRVRTFPWPALCRGDVPGSPPSLRAASDDELLLNCPAPPGQLNAVVVNATTGAAALATAVPPNLGFLPDSAWASGIGHEWLRIGVSGYHYGVTLYVSRRDGHVEEDVGAARRQPDLDRGDLMAPLCSPLKRPPIPNPDDIVGYDTRFNLELSGRLALNTWGESGPMLQRCGSRTKKRLPCRARCRATTLSDGAVAWMRGQTAHVLVPATGRRVKTRMHHGRFVALLGGRLVLVESDDAVWRLRTSMRVPRAPALVPRGALLVIKRSHLLVLNQRGRIVRRLGRFPDRRAIQGMAISGDRRHAFVSIYRPDRTPRLFEVDLATGRRMTVADAASPAVSPGDGRLAYVTTAQPNDIAYLTALVVRTGSDPPREIPMGTSEVVGIGWPIVNWSPDGRRIAISADDQVRLVDPATATSVASQPAVLGRRLLAPAFVTDDTLIGLTNCCIGDQRLTSVNLTTGKRTPFAVLPAPPVSLGRVRRNVFFAVVATQQLALVRKGKVQIIARDVAGAAS